MTLEPSSVSAASTATEAAVASILLRKGALLLKYCRHGKPHVCFVQLSQDERELQWVSGAGKPRLLPLAALRAVVRGQQTAVFRRHPGLFPAIVSFSLVYREDGSERTLDLVCKDKEQLRLWTAGLQALLERGSAAPSDAKQTAARALSQSSKVAVQAHPAGLAGSVNAAAPPPLPHEVLYWGHHAVSAAKSLGAAKRDRVAPPTRAGVAAEGKALVPTLLRRAEASDVAAVSFSSHHGALLLRDGGVCTWGASESGELGHGSQQRVVGPQRVEALRATRVVQLACGSARTVAVTDEGRLLMWGDTTAFGSPAISAAQSQWLPRQVRGALEGVVVTQVACGPYHTALVAASGAVYTWGEGVFGALGHGDAGSQPVPRRVEALALYTALQVSCGVWHTAALARSTRAGDDAHQVRLFIWGDGEKGQLGSGRREGLARPHCVGDELAAQSLRQVACGALHTVVLTAAGAVYVAGKDSASPSRPTFTRVLGLLADTRVEQVACGERHTCVLAADGRGVFSWGSGAGGRLGLGDERDCDSPTLVEGLRGRDVRLVVCGPECTAAVCAVQRLTVEEKAAQARALDELGFTTTAEALPDATDANGAGADGVGSSEERERAMRVVQTWRRAADHGSSQHPLLLGLTRGGAPAAPLAEPAAPSPDAVPPVAQWQLQALERELRSARETMLSLQAQLASSTRPAHRARAADAYTMTEAPPPPPLPQQQPGPPTAGAPSGASASVVHAVHPGVFVTAEGRVLRRVRFDRRRFDDEQASEWWEGNRDRVLSELALVLPGSGRK